MNIIILQVGRLDNLLHFPPDIPNFLPFCVDSLGDPHEGWKARCEQGRTFSSASPHWPPHDYARVVLWCLIHASSFCHFLVSVTRRGGGFALTLWFEPIQVSGSGLSCADPLSSSVRCSKHIDRCFSPTFCPCFFFVYKSFDSRRRWYYQVRDV